MKNLSLEGKCAKELTQKSISNMEDVPNDEEMETEENKEEEMEME